MKGNVLHYKGYRTVVETGDGTPAYHGIIEGTRDFVNYVADNMAEAEAEFHKAVDDYLDKLRREYGFNV